MHGRKAHLPIQLTQTTSELDEDDFEAKVKRMAELRVKVLSNALANIEKAQERQKKHYDAKHNTNTKLKVGDKVLVKDMKNEGRKGGKLEQLFRWRLGQRSLPVEGWKGRSDEDSNQLS